MLPLSAAIVMMAVARQQRQVALLLLATGIKFAYLAIKGI